MATLSHTQQPVTPSSSPGKRLVPTISESETFWARQRSLGRAVFAAPPRFSIAALGLGHRY